MIKFENVFKKYMEDQDATKRNINHRSGLFDSMLWKVINGRNGAE